MYLITVVDHQWPRKIFSLPSRIESKIHPKFRSRYPHCLYWELVENRKYTLDTVSARLVPYNRPYPHWINIEQLWNCFHDPSRSSAWLAPTLVVLREKQVIICHGGHFLRDLFHQVISVEAAMPMTEYCWASLRQQECFDYLTSTW